MKERNVQCPDCKGSGWELIEYDDVVGNTSSFSDTCGNCEGEGFIKEELKGCAGCQEVHWIRASYDECEPCMDAGIEAFVKEFLMEGGNSNV